MAAGTRPAMVFGAGVVACRAALSLLIPPVETADRAVMAVDSFEGGFEPIEIDPAVILEWRHRARRR